MRLLIDQTLVTTVYALPFVSGWVEAPEATAVELAPGLRGSHLTAEDSAVIPTSELLALRDSHQVVGDIAVIAGGVGAIAMRTPVRPDEVAQTPVRLVETSGVAEILGRATLEPFYGIVATTWLRHDEPPGAMAEVVIVEGAEALREPEAGFSEDLCRAWFILTGQPVITHVLAVPRTLQAGQLGTLIAVLDTARAEALARRSDWRPRVADTEGFARDRGAALWMAQRLRLEEADRQALRDLLAKGSSATSGSSPVNVDFIDAGGR